MKRILMVVAVAALMVAMVVVMAAPGFAAKKCEPPEDEDLLGVSCRGGEGARGGTIGTAGQQSFITDPDTGTLDVALTGGEGNGAGGPGVQGGGGGGRNASVTGDIVGGNFDGQVQGGGGGGGHNREPDGGSGGQCSLEDGVIVEEHGDCPNL